MTRLNVVELRHSLGDILNRAEYRGERIVIQRQGKDAAALIPIADLRLLERLIEEEEDRIDRARGGRPGRVRRPDPLRGGPPRAGAHRWARDAAVASRGRARGGMKSG